MRVPHGLHQASAVGNNARRIIEYVEATLGRAVTVRELAHDSQLELVDPFRPCPSEHVASPVSNGETGECSGMWHDSTARLVQFRHVALHGRHVVDAQTVARAGYCGKTRVNTRLLMPDRPRVAWMPPPSAATCPDCAPRTAPG